MGEVVIFVLVVFVAAGLLSVALCYSQWLEVQSAMLTINKEPELVGPELRVAYLTPEMFDHYWPDIEKLLDAQPELWNQVFTKQNIRDRVHSLDIQSWVVFNGSVIRLVFLTQRCTAPNGVVTLQIFWMHGSGLRDVLWLLEDVIDKFAAALNCTRLEVVGRKGFERLLAPFGAEYQCTVLSRPVRTTREN